MIFQALFSTRMKKAGAKVVILALKIKKLLSLSKNELHFSVCFCCGSVWVGYQSKKDSKDQESIQSSTTPVPGYKMGK